MRYYVSPSCLGSHARILFLISSSCSQPGTLWLSCACIPHHLFPSSLVSQRHLVSFCDGSTITFVPNTTLSKQQPSMLKKSVEGLQKLPKARSLILFQILMPNHNIVVESSTLQHTKFTPSVTMPHGYADLEPLTRIRRRL